MVEYFLPAVGFLQRPLKFPDCNILALLYFLACCFCFDVPIQPEGL